MTESRDCSECVDQQAIMPVSGMIWSFIKWAIYMVICFVVAIGPQAMIVGMELEKGSLGRFFLMFIYVLGAFAFTLGIFAAAVALVAFAHRNIIGKMVYVFRDEQGKRHDHLEPPRLVKLDEDEYWEWEKDVNGGLDLHRITAERAGEIKGYFKNLAVAVGPILRLRSGGWFRKTGIIRTSIPLKDDFQWEIANWTLSWVTLKSARAEFKLSPEDALMIVNNFDKSHSVMWALEMHSRDHRLARQRGSRLNEIGSAATFLADKLADSKGVVNRSPYAQWVRQYLEKVLGSGRFDDRDIELWRHAPPWHDGRQLEEMWEEAMPESLRKKMSA